MSRVVSVDKSLISGGTVQWFVTMEDDGGNRTRVQVGEEEAKRFQAVIQAESGGHGGPRILTETMPY
jgi:hypothetical protein